MPDQRSLKDQLDDLEKMAAQAGLYDALDFLRDVRKERAEQLASLIDRVNRGLAEAEKQKAELKKRRAKRKKVLTSLLNELKKRRAKRLRDGTGASNDSPSADRRGRSPC